ncbi:MAG: M20/M25/M40 family metallo-hydrolase, partial [Phycisphaerales bacterium]|nr:M20/M25/M40 family metallo-hydrolase [Phycisphaerales bacterium]
MAYDLETVFSHIDDHLDDSLERLKSLLRIPSVSTDPAFDPEVLRCAQCAGDMLKEIGMDVTVHDTIGHPIVIARDNSCGSETAPTFLYYGHYDVQPADPYDLWDSDPFDPQMVDGPNGPRIVARGADDDKGQLMTFVEAFRAWKAVHGTLPVNVIVLLEGEEES